LNASKLNVLEDADQFDFAFRERGIRRPQQRPARADHFCFATDGVV